MKDLKRQKEGTAPGKKVRRKGGGDCPLWLDALMSWADTALALIQHIVQ